MHVNNLGTIIEDSECVYNIKWAVGPGVQDNWIVEEVREVHPLVAGEILFQKEAGTHIIHLAPLIHLSHLELSDLDK